MEAHGASKIYLESNLIALHTTFKDPNFNHIQQYKAMMKASNKTNGSGSNVMPTSFKNFFLLMLKPS
jgi:hypothetical protein